jgi:hypothetical protein
VVKAQLEQLVCKAALGQQARLVCREQQDRREAQREQEQMLFSFLMGKL